MSSGFSNKRVTSLQRENNMIASVFNTDGWEKGDCNINRRFLGFKHCVQTLCLGSSFHKLNQILRVLWLADRHVSTTIS